MSNSIALELMLKVLKILKARPKQWQLFEQLLEECKIPRPVLRIILWKLYQLNLIEIEYPEGQFYEWSTEEVKTELRTTLKTALKKENHMASHMLDAFIFRWNN